MIARLVILTVALIGLSKGAEAQSVVPLDPNGRPYISSGPQPSPGDYTREMPGMQRDYPRDASSRQGAERDTVFKDGYGFRYNDRGDRIDGRGRIISPQSTQR